ncbi:MAG: nucleotidyl transferase AbiEii/AbiGii toxin family protein [bacterium]|nr:nucleotidyl transferase AbiEii/AbiGii toxin family protein [bacterium]
MVRHIRSLSGSTLLQTAVSRNTVVVLYKLCLLLPARYSEDLDFVQITSEPIRETLDHIHDALAPWLGSPRYRETADRE